MEAVTGRTSEPTHDQALKPERVAEQMDVTVYTVHDWLRSGQLKGIKLKSHWRVMQSDLNDFINSRRTGDVFDDEDEDEDES